MKPVRPPVALAGGQRIVILGGGAGGLELASQLGKRSGVETVLVDREGTHVWKPRLHEMAAGTVATSMAEISFYLLGQMRHFRFEQGEVEAIDRERRRVRLAPMRNAAGAVLAEAREIPYDLCVVALGGTTPDFGVQGVAENAIRLDGLDDARDFRERYVAQMVEARSTGRPAEIAIIGSGPTGTELAAHLRESERGFIDPQAPDRQGKLLSITILEAGPELMPGIDARLRQEINERLRALDIKVVTDAEITEVGEGELRTATGESWPSDLTVWATGLVGNPVLKDIADFELDKKGRIVVDEYLRTVGDRRIFALGDSAAFTPGDEERPLPPTAQAASQQAEYLADILPRSLGGDPDRAFSFANRGRIVSLGLAGTVGRVRLSVPNDLFINGQFAIAAYHALERQHQFKVLGRLRGSAAVIADLVTPAMGPSLKLHGG